MTRLLPALLAALALGNSFQSIAGIGTHSNMVDDAAPIVRLPFGCPLYGDVYSEAAVHTNGIVYIVRMQAGRAVRTVRVVVAR